MLIKQFDMFPAFPQNFIYFSHFLIPLPLAFFRFEVGAKQAFSLHCWVYLFCFDVKLSFSDTADAAVMWRAWHGDGQKDCSDGRDELYCDITILVIYYDCKLIFKYFFKFIKYMFSIKQKCPMTLQYFHQLFYLAFYK